MDGSTSAQPRRERQSKIAAASGWIGSALEYYDFLIYATAASLVFPQLFFPAGNSTVAIIASLATFGVGYVARPVGAMVLGHVGDRHGRKTVLIFCMFLMGISTMGVGILPTYQQVGIWAPVMLVILRLVQGFAVAGELSGASSMILEHAPFGRRGYFTSFTIQGSQAGQLLAFGVFLPLAHFMPKTSSLLGAGEFRSCSALSLSLLVTSSAARFAKPRLLPRSGLTVRFPALPSPKSCDRIGADVLRVVCMALTAVVVFLATVFGTTYAVQPAYGIGFPAGVYLWIPVLGNVCSVILIPFVGRLSDKIGRRPPVLVGALSAGLFSFGFLYAISIHNLWLSLIFSALMWGIAYQGFNGVFPSLFPELSKVRKFIASSHAGGSFIDERSLDRACIAPQIDSSITGILTFSVSQCIGLTRVRGH